MKLNKSGILKIVKYIGEDKCKYIYDDGRHLLAGNFTEDDKNKISDVGIVLNEIFGNVLYEAELDSTEVEPEIEAEKPENNIPDERDYAELAKELIPHLIAVFPTKEELNQVLNNLQGRSIDPDEMIDGLKSQIRRIEKNSRASDEVG